MRGFLVVLAWASAACGSVTHDDESCALIEGEYEKSWFVGELASADDDPRFSLKVEVIGVESPFELEPAFANASTSYDVGFEVTENLLIARRPTEPKVPVAYAIRSHRAPCDEPHDYHSSQPIGDPDPTPARRPWYERAWFRVDWSLNLSDRGFRFDAASLAGDTQSVTYTPVVVSPDEATPELDADRWVVIGKHWLEWEDPQSCAVDFPGLAPGTECSPVSVTLRYEFRRLP